MRHRPTARLPKALRADPVKACDLALEPSGFVRACTRRLAAQLARELRARGAPFTLDELDARCAALYRELEASGLCQRRPDVRPVVAKVIWLRAQQKYIERLARTAVGRRP